jgi:hypothetical protein
MQDRFEKLGLGPEVKFEIEVIESPRGKFRVVAASFYRGQMCQISGEIEPGPKGRGPSIAFG